MLEAGWALAPTSLGQPSVSTVELVTRSQPASQPASTSIASRRCSPSIISQSRTNSPPPPPPTSSQPSVCRCNLPPSLSPRQAGPGQTVRCRGHPSNRENKREPTSDTRPRDWPRELAPKPQSALCRWWRLRPWPWSWPAGCWPDVGMCCVLCAVPGSGGVGLWGRWGLGARGVVAPVWGEAQEGRGCLGHKENPCCCSQNTLSSRFFFVLFVPNACTPRRNSTLPRSTAPVDRTGLRGRRLLAGSFSDFCDDVAWLLVVPSPTLFNSTLNPFIDRQPV